MKNLFSISGVILLFLSIFLIFSCKKDKPTPPIVSTTAVTEISYTTATSGGSVTDEGGAPVFARGVCWNTSADPTIANSTTVESGGLGSFASNITLLTPNKMYYVRAYATNSTGTGYGNQVSFTTSQVAVPVLTTTAITSITQTSAVSGGNITSENGGSVTIRGVCWGTSSNPIAATNSTITDIAGGIGTFTSLLTGLTPNTTYYVRAFAVNSAGAAYGNEISFLTAATIPTLTTTKASSITATAASTGGNITSDGGTRINNGKGVCWSTSPNPTTANDKMTDFTEGIGAFTISLTGLTANTTYYVKAFAINNVGTAYGNEISFTTLETVTDVDGNVYNTVIIGTQKWMKENLKVTKYRNAEVIGTTTPANLDIDSETGSKYQWAFDGLESNVAVYGRLYTWYAATDSRGLCPTGWHLPSDAEWTTLTTYLGGESTAGGKLKEAGTIHWHSPNTGATNESGFTGLPGSYRGSDGSFGNIGSFGTIGDGGTWWSSTVTTYGWFRYLFYDVSSVGRLDSDLKSGYSVRCVKD